MSERLRAAIRDIPDFPKPGILFKDITPVLADPRAFAEALDLMEAHWKTRGLDVIAGIESRGFVFAAPLADRLRLPLVPIRKQGKLPAATHRHEYALEYGTDVVEIHRDAFSTGSKVLIVDDLLATGGTAAAAAALVEVAGGVVAGFAFLVNLAFLPGAQKIARYEAQYLVEFS